MGNIFTQEKKLEKDIKFSKEFENLDNKAKIKRIIEHVVKNMADKQLCKTLLYRDSNNILKSKKVFDLELLEEKNKEFRIPYDISKDEYMILNKKEYVLFLFRIIEQIIPSININNIIGSKLNIYNTDMNREYCNRIVLRFKYLETINNTNDLYHFRLVIPEHLNDNLIQEYEKHLSNNYNSTEISNFIQILKNNSIKEGYIKTYESRVYQFDMYTANNDLKFSILSLFTFLIILCKNNFLFIGLNLDYQHANIPNSTESHRNELFVQKEYKTIFKKQLTKNS